MRAPVMGCFLAKYLGEIFHTKVACQPRPVYETEDHGIDTISKPNYDLVTHISLFNLNN